MWYHYMGSVMSGARAVLTSFAGTLAGLPEDRFALGFEAGFDLAGALLLFFVDQYASFSLFFGLSFLLDLERLGLRNS